MNIRNQSPTQILKQFYQQPIAQVSSGLVFSIMAVIVFAIFAIRPTLLTMSDLIKEMQDKEQLNQELTQKIAALSSVQTLYANNQNQLAVLDQAMPPNPRIGEAVAIIEKVASQNNLLISDLEASDVPLENSTATGSAEKVRVSTPIIVTVQGDYPVIKNFVNDMQKTQRLFVIDSVIFSQNDTHGQKVLRATVTIDIQYFGNAI